MADRPARGGDEPRQLNVRLLCGLAASQYPVSFYRGEEIHLQKHEGIRGEQLDFMSSAGSYRDGHHQER